MAADSIVHWGGCYLGDDLIHCALESSHCLGLTFRSSRDATTDEKRCFGPQQSEPLGMCTSAIDQYHCTGDASNCAIPSKFVPQIPYCTLRYNHYPDRTVPLTLYGVCAPGPDNIPGRVLGTTCVWSIDSCPLQANVFTPASFSAVGTANSAVATKDLCTCDKVRTGACNSGGGNWNCAVSADACAADESFVDWQSLDTQFNRKCYLCDSIRIEANVVKHNRVWEPACWVGTTPAGSIGAGVGGLMSGVVVTVLGTFLWGKRCRKRRVQGGASKDSTFPTKDADETQEIETGGVEMETLPGLT